MLRNESSISSVWRAGTKSCNTPDNGTAGSPPAPGQQETWLATRYSPLSGVTAPEHSTWRLRTAWPQGCDVLRICWGCKVWVCEALPASSTHKAKTGLTFSSSQRWEGRTRTCWELSAASPGPQLRALTQGCCISHPSTLGTAYGFLLKDTTEQRTCFVSLKLIFSTKGDPFSFFCFSFSGESFYHTHIPFFCWEELVSALGLLFFNLFPPCRCSFTTINM